METATTRGVKVSVETFYQPDYSNPMLEEFMFAYRITISNLGAHAIKLLKRHWIIVDAFGVNREVEGEGVVGQQPILAPGESYQYISGCNLKTEVGKMHGTYLMQRLSDGKMFYVNIPVFKLIASMKLN
jgi:ApaG protein